MTTAAAALLSAVLARLRADPDLAAALGGRLWDTAPRDPGFPHCVVDEVTSRDRSGLDVALAEHRLVLRLVSRAGGRVELLALVERIETALADDDLALVGHRLVRLRREALDTRPTRDRLGTEALLRFVVLTEPA